MFAKHADFNDTYEKLNSMLDKAPALLDALTIEDKIFKQFYGDIDVCWRNLSAYYNETSSPDWNEDTQYIRRLCGDDKTLIKVIFGKIFKLYENVYCKVRDTEHKRMIYNNKAKKRLETQVVCDNCCGVYNVNSIIKHKRSEKCKRGGTPKIAAEFKCEFCEYTTKTKCNYERHMINKH